MFILALYDHEFNMKTLVLIILLPGRKGVSSTTGFLKKKGNETVSILFWSFYKM